MYTFLLPHTLHKPDYLIFLRFNTRIFSVRNKSKIRYYSLYTNVSLIFLPPSLAQIHSWTPYCKTHTSNLLAEVCLYTWSTQGKSELSYIGLSFDSPHMWIYTVLPSGSFHCWYYAPSVIDEWNTSKDHWRKTVTGDKRNTHRTTSSNTNINPTRAGLNAKAVLRTERPPDGRLGHI